MLKQSTGSHSLIIACIISYLYAQEKFSQKISATYTAHAYAHHFILNLILTSWFCCLFNFFHKFGIHFSTKVIGESSFGRENVFHGRLVNETQCFNSLLIFNLHETRTQFYISRTCAFNSVSQERAMGRRLNRKPSLVGKMWYSKMQKLGGKKGRSEKIKKKGASDRRKEWCSERY